MTLNTTQRQTLRSLFAGVQSPHQERKAISKAVGLLEGYAGQQSRIYRDKGENYRDEKGPGSLDCIAETLNTLNWLKLLNELQLLRWHTDPSPLYRDGFWVSQHWGVSIKETTTGQLYVVDSWPRDNGRAAMVQNAEDWHSNEAMDESLVD